jgi:ApaG protein
MTTPYTATTAGIKVSVVPTPLVAESQPEDGVYAFAYTVTVENVGHEPCQLMERHWFVFSDGEQVAEVMGPGVVGEQPEIAPGESYTYTSSTVIYDSIGEMFGTYTFVTAEGRSFEAVIPRFHLAFPGVVH